MEIIAEAGTAHGGDLEKAKDLISAAKEAGADTVKFQAVLANEILHPKTGNVFLHGRERPLYDEFRNLEKPRSFYEALLSMTKDAGLRFLCSVFGLESAKMLRDIGTDRLKIASPELNHHPLLEAAASYQIPLILSSGVSRLGDIEEALDITGRIGVGVLHCVTAYPAPPEDYRLSLLGPLSAVFGVPFGVSDHSLDPCTVPLTSLVAGSAVLEKHLTLSKKDPGLDDPVALEPQGFATMVKLIRKGESLSPRELYDFAHNRLGKELERTLGEGPKELAASERSNYGRTNRSLHAVGDLDPGTVLSPQNFSVLRTEKELSPGLHPRFYRLLMGKRLVKGLKAGEGIRWEHLLTGDVQGEP